MVTIKRTLVVVAAALAVASTSAMAQGVKMTDAQLDEITAAGAGALNVIIISNPGNANVGRNVDLENFNPEMNVKCINCTELAPMPVEGRTGGVVLVANRKFPLGSRPLHCVGGGVQGLC